MELKGNVRRYSTDKCEYGTFVVCWEFKQKLTLLGWSSESRKMQLVLEIIAVFLISWRSLWLIPESWPRHSKLQFWNSIFFVMDSFAVPQHAVYQSVYLLYRRHGKMSRHVCSSVKCTYFFFAMIIKFTCFLNHDSSCWALFFRRVF